MTGRQPRPHRPASPLRRPGRIPVALVTLAAAALPLSACGQGSDGRLALASAGRAPAGVAVAAAGGPAGGSGRYHVVGPLPDGPRTAAVRQLAAVPDADLLGRVSALARALGLTSAARRDGRTISVTDGPHVLRVAAVQGAPWTYVDQFSPACLPVPDQPDLWGDQGSAVGCAAPDAGSAEAATTAPSTARELAGPVLAAGSSAPLGPAEVVQGPPTEIRATPTVGGADAFGVGTAAAVAGGRVVWAYGWLGLSAAAPGRTYPLRPASDLVDALAQEPVPMPACPAPTGPDGAAPACRGPADVAITGARLALVLDVGTSGRLLVPAWELQVRGRPPVVRVAVAPQALVPLGSVTSGGGAATGSGGSSAGSSSVGSPVSGGGTG
ncbi:MAG TPA: hypothetical protein VFS29_04250 [Motilibacteraceae bacterium]|nr:hypothetical protein [Motilibacteraceae bacterium]